MFRVPACVAAMAILTASPVHAQFGPEMKVHLTVESPESVPADTNELATTVQLGIGQAGCAPNLLTDPPDPMRDEYLQVSVRIRANGTHRIQGAYRRGDQVVPAFENTGDAGYGPLLGALLASAVRQAAVPRCASGASQSARR